MLCSVMYMNLRFWSEDFHQNIYEHNEDLILFRGILHTNFYLAFQKSVSLSSKLFHLKARSSRQNHRSPAHFENPEY
jgi:hypothetical protein